MSLQIPLFPPLSHILVKGQCEIRWMVPRQVLNFLLHEQAGLSSFGITADMGTQNESLGSYLHLHSLLYSL